MVIVMVAYSESFWVYNKALKTRYEKILKLRDGIRILHNLQCPVHILCQFMTELYETLVRQFDYEESIVNMLSDDKYAFFKMQHIKYHDEILDMVEFTCSILRSRCHPTGPEYFPRILSTLIDNMIDDDKRLIEYLNDECIEYHSFGTR